MRVLPLVFVALLNTFFCFHRSKVCYAGAEVFPFRAFAKLSIPARARSQSHPTRRAGHEERQRHPGAHAIAHQSLIVSVESFKYRTNRIYYFKYL